MREPVEVTIQGETYELTPLGAIKGRQVLARLIRVLGGAAGGLDGAGSGGDKMVAAMASILEGLNEETIAFLCDTFGEQTRHYNDAGKKPKLTRELFDEHFAQRYSAMTEWLLACLKLNFADFLDVQNVEGLAARLKT